MKYILCLILCSCAPGKDGTSITGAPGLSGHDGADGVNGISCTVTTISEGALVTCQDGSSSIIHNGEVGSVGPSGPQGPGGLNSIINVINPCGDSPHLIDEVLLQMSDGSYLAFFTDNIHGDYGRLALLTPGHYMTTDGQNCYFTITSDGKYKE